MKKTGNIPHVYIMFMLVMLLVVALSWVVPSGEYNRIADPDNPGLLVVDPDSFHYVDDAKPITVMDYFRAFHIGVAQSVDIIVMLLIVVGALYLLETSGAIGAAIHSLLRIAAGKETLIISLLILIFATLGTIGFGEGGIPFIPLAATVVMGMGYDRMTGFATAAGGLAVGFTAGAVNFYTTGVAQMITRLPLYSGLFFRLISFVVLVIITILYVVYFAKQVKNDPTKSVVSEEYIQQLADAKTADAIEGEPFTTRRKIALLGLVVQLVVSVYGAINQGWAMSELSGCTLFMPYS